MVKVNQAKCIGCRNCVAICPKVFKMGEDEKSHVKKGQEGNKDPCVEKAIIECPAHAISK